MFMKYKIPSKYLFLFFCVVVLLSNNSLLAQKKEFVLVLDAGHGGHDPGAVGKISREKDITLTVVRLVGNLIDKRLPDVKVVYTRKTDVFIPLEERASIANNNHADMFISIHVNAAKSRAAYGAETYTLGLAKSQSNLDVAMAENAVMLLEDDYQTKYRGFDPSSVDSYIMFEFMMDTYMDNSISFATDIQKQFTHSAKRFDRGVRQAGFWVLHRSACPSVLIELGFISNYSEEMYLTSNIGQNELAECIYSAFLKYKNNHYKKLNYSNGDDGDSAGVQKKRLEENRKEKEVKDSGNIKVAPVNTKSEALNSEENKQIPVFKIQIKASPTPLKNNNHTDFKGLKNVDHYKEGGMYKYTYGAETEYSKITKLKNDINAKFPDAFIIAFVGDKKIAVKEALKYVK
jgi:N-acetylmuramoyl-L-alanine amidase